MNIREDLKLSETTDKLKDLHHKLFRKVFNHIYDGLFIHDASGEILDVNERVLEMYKISREEVLQYSFVRDLSAKQQKIKNLSDIWNAAAAGKDQVFEWKARRPHDGSTFNVEVFLSDIQITEETLIIATVRDISQRKNMETELTETKDKIQKLHEFALQIGNRKREQEVYNMAIDVAEDILDLQMCMIDTVDDNMLIPTAVSSHTPQNGFKAMHINSGISGQTYRNQKTYIIDDIQSHPTADPVREDYRSIISVPIRDIGIFQCVSDQVGTFNQETAELLEILTSHIAASVQRIRSEHYLKEQMKEVEHLAAEYEVILEGTQDGMFLLDVNTDGTFTLQRANNSLRELVGSSSLETGKNLDKFFSEVRWKHLSNNLVACQKQKTPVLFQTHININGEMRYFSVLVSPVVENNRTTQIVGSIRETTSEQKAKKALQESEEMYRTLVEQASDIIVIVQNNRHVYVNEAVGEILGYEPAELIHTHYLDIIHENERGKVAQFTEARKTNKDISSIYETVLKHRSGKKVHVEVNVNEITYQGSTAKMTIMRDITSRKEAEKMLRYLSFHDQLTGLYNRAYFENELERLDVPRQLPLSIILCDVNGLKMVNDAFGHQYGDELLEQIAEFLKSCCRKEDVIARIGGDEFCIIFPKTSKKDAEDIIQRIQSKDRNTETEPINFSLSVGCATKAHESQDIWTIFSKAEEQMYRDKLLKRDSVRNAIIKSLTNALEEKTLETQDHIKRLETLSNQLGRQMNLNENDLSNLSLLAKLHDIGKVAIPNSILGKKHPLTSSEWEEIKRHPEIGYRIAQSTVELAPISEAILSHHEWWNGKGYPRGLKGRQIPKLARILTVVDAYDAMTRNQPYRRRLSKSKALEEINSLCGRQFDPNIVEEFLAIKKEG